MPKNILFKLCIKRREFRLLYRHKIELMISLQDNLQFKQVFVDGKTNLIKNVIDETEITQIDEKFN